MEAMWSGSDPKMGHGEPGRLLDLLTGYVDFWEVIQPPPSLD